MNTAISDRDSGAEAALNVLSILVLATAVGIAGFVVATRGLDVGTDTRVYAEFFRTYRPGVFDTRLEPGFVFLTWAVHALGLGVTGFQATLFGLLMLTIVLSTRKYFRHIGCTRGYLTYVSAAFAMLFFSPMFVNASINAVRQGLASMLVFTGLIAFYRREWVKAVLYAATATSIHYSSALYFLFAPVLLLRPRSQRIIAFVVFALYCSGASMWLVETAAPGVYSAVMDYQAGAAYRSGVRLDFAAFSAFWYLLPRLASRFVRPPFSARIQDSLGVYAVMLMPFCAVGWGNFSNRYLLPAWLSISVIVAALLFQSRFTFLRNPLMLRCVLIASCGVYSYLVMNVVVI